VSIEGEGTWLRPPSISTGGAFSGARLAQAADYTITPSSFIELPWDTVVFDVGGYVGSSGGNVCFIAPATGYYVLQAVSDWLLTGKTSGSSKIVKNWVQTTALGIIAKDEIMLPTTSPATDYAVMFNLNSGPVYIASGDVIQHATQITTHADIVNGTTFGGVTYWTIMRVG
jgi:hypothetical protein